MKQPLRQHTFWVIMRGITILICGIFLLWGTTNTALANTLETANYYTDTDGDGIPDETDIDDDNDGIVDSVEDFNTDGDGKPETHHLCH